LGPVDLSEWIDSPLINWVIVGGESGPGARPVHPDWVRAVRDQCLGAGVPFFFKQWGEWRPYRLAPEPRSRPFAGSHDWGDGVYSQRVGKKRAGNVLDGVIWDQVPASGLLGRTES